MPEPSCSLSIHGTLLGRRMSPVGLQARVRAITATVAALAGCGARTGLLDEAPGTEVDGGASAQNAVATGSTRSAPSSPGVSNSTSLSSGPITGPPSCQPGGPGMTNCGPGGSGSESCCTSLEVIGGTYDRTYANNGAGATGGANPATVSGFRMDKYLVTVSRFRQYVKYLTGPSGAPPANGSGIHTHLNGGLGLANSGSPGTYETGWDDTDWNAYIATGSGAASTWNASLTVAAVCGPLSTWTTGAGSQENLPINCVDWYEAYAFCIWDGGFLPSEAEWEYVAAGGSQQREYPWGSTDPGTASQYAIYGDGFNCYYPTGMLDSCLGVANIAPVGKASLGASYWGQLDMAGEEWEWNLDWYAAYVDPCADCAYLTTALTRVFRGGSFGVEALDLLPQNRLSGNPTSGYSGEGFRCARTP